MRSAFARGAFPTRARWLGAAAGLALSSAACGDAGFGERVGESSSAVTTKKGVDYSWYRPSPSTLVSDGYKFVVRYASHDTTGKNLSKSEADALVAAGLDVVCNWENGAQDALNGHDQGVADAKAAEQECSADGQPAGRPIYFSVDFDATPGDETAINAYFDGVASVIGLDWSGAYGGYYVVKRLFDAGKIKWGWQTYAWSGGQWDARAQLRQIQNGIAGGQMDEDESEADDFGQWGHTATPPPDQPKGYLDQATCAAVSGWTQDPAVPTTAIFADVYYDGAAGASGAHGVRLAADVSRQDLCTAIGSCDHGFSMPAPRSLMDDQKHDVYAYGINHASGGVNTLLTGSPKSIACTAPAVGPETVKRHVVSPAILADWRFDTFLDMAPYATAEIAAVPSGADLAVAPDVVQAPGDPAVYVVDGGHRRHVVNPDSLAAWRLTSKDIQPISAAALGALVDGPDWPLAPLLAKDPADPAVYLLDVPLSAPGGAADGGAGAHGDGGAGVVPDGGATSSSGGSGGSGGGGADGDASGGGAGGGCAVSPDRSAHGLGGLLVAVGAASLAGRRRRERGATIPRPCRPRRSSPPSWEERPSSPGASARRSSR